MSLDLLRPIAAFLLVTVMPLSAAPDDRRPNVIVILTDDQGSVDAGCYGAQDLKTPAIDGLASRGLRFTQYYAAAPVCSPSRASLLTGLYPKSAGLTGNAGSQKGEKGLPGDRTTIAEVFRSAGYATAHVGKWHLGYRQGEFPNDQGFGFSFGHMGGCVDNFSHFFYWQGANRHDLHRNGTEVFHPGEFLGDLMVREACGFMQENRDRPFLLYFALNMPHYPYQGDVRWLEHYRALPYPRNLYAAFLSTADERMAQLLRKVDDLGLRHETIVVFASDNGHSVEDRAHGGGGSAGTYRGAKFSLFEGGIRVPCIISWPGHLPEGEVRSQLAHATDILPTLADLCGIPLPDRSLDGHSLVPVLRSASAPSLRRELHWGASTRSQWAIREGDWKLIGHPQTAAGDPLAAADREHFLANLATDPGERTNLAQQHPEIVERLAQRHRDWLHSVSTPGAPDEE